MHRLFFPLNLMTRVVLLVSIGLILMFAGFAFLSLQAVEESTQRTLQERMLIAQLSASRVDDLLKQKILVLQASIDDGIVDPLAGNTESIHMVLQTLSRHLGDSVNYMALLDDKGIVLWTEPYMANLVGYDVSSNRFVEQALKDRQPVVSGYFAPSNVNASAALLVPINKPNASHNGILLAAVNLKHPSISRLLGPFGIGQRGYAEIVDEDGFPLVSTWEEKSWVNCRYGDRFYALIREKGNTVGRCHDCHTTSADARRQNGVMAFAALTTAPWGVVVQQDEEEAFAYRRDLEQNLLLFGGLAFLITLFVAWLLTRSVVRPIRSLTTASEQIAAGDLTHPVPQVGGGEVSILARAFDEMRARLKKSLEEIQGWNRELEHRVEQRTQALEEAEQARRELIRKLVVTQEEERKFLARELHDETSQALTALVVGLETITAGSANSVDEIKSKLEPTKTLAMNMLREVQRIILDLRPAILDDLGLVQAIDWFAETRLKPKGVQVSLETIGVEKRLPSEVETVVFRIAQEAISNIVRHAKAENASITLGFESSRVVLEVEDDGCGFSPAQSFGRQNGGTSFGLLGMRERVMLFGGTLQIESQKGQGTRLIAMIPVDGARGNGQDSHSAR